MVNQEKINNTANKVSSIYKRGISDVVSKLIKAKDKLDNVEFIKAVQQINLTEVLQIKLKDIKKEYLKSHIQILKEKEPIK